jgi:hypothetical protein
VALEDGGRERRREIDGGDGNGVLTRGGTAEPFISQPTDGGGGDVVAKQAEGGQGTRPLRTRAGRGWC